jgi:hypothetical protein
MRETGRKTTTHCQECIWTPWLCLTPQGYKKGRETNRETETAWLLKKKNYKWDIECSVEAILSFLIWFEEPLSCLPLLDIEAIMMRRTSSTTSEYIDTDYSAWCWHILSFVGSTSWLEWEWGECIEGGLSVRESGRHLLFVKSSIERIQMKSSLDFIVSPSSFPVSSNDIIGNLVIYETYRNFLNRWEGVFDSREICWWSVFNDPNDTLQLQTTHKH